MYTESDSMMNVFYITCCNNRKIILSLIICLHYYFKNLFIRLLYVAILDHLEG